MRIRKPIGSKSLYWVRCPFVILLTGGTQPTSPLVSLIHLTLAFSNPPAVGIIFFRSTDWFFPTLPCRSPRGRETFDNSHTFLYDYQFTAESTLIDTRLEGLVVNS